MVRVGLELALGNFESVLCYLVTLKGALSVRVSLGGNSSFLILIVISISFEWFYFIDKLLCSACLCFRPRNPSFGPKG